MEYVDTGDVSYAASDLAVVTKEGRVLLADVSFEQPQRSFLAVIGPSGAGKSILLDALTFSMIFPVDTRIFTVDTRR